MKRRAAIVLGLALVLSGTGAGALAQHAHDHHDHAGHDDADHAAATQTPAAQPLYTAEDLHFLHHMIAHHEQALEMSALIPARTERDELRRFARYIERAQRAEIAMMRAMLDMAAARGLSVPHVHHEGDPPMAGMLSSAEMAALAAADGAAFERLWLEAMTFHHEGGLAMARAQQLHQAMHGRRPYGLEILVEDILIEQRVEIAQMQDWLREWGLREEGLRDAAADSRRAPVAEVASPPPEAVLTAGQTATLLGVAVGEAAINAVHVGVRDMAADRWLRADGSWGERALHAADLVGSGPSSTAWRFDFTPPAAGRYELAVETEDAAGARAPGAARILLAQ